jgi:cytoskeletal protein RodZ
MKHRNEVVTMKKYMILIGLIGFLWIAFLGYQDQNSPEALAEKEAFSKEWDKKQAEKKAKRKAEIAKQDAEIAKRLTAQMSIEEFNNIQTGMSYQQVLDIAGNGKQVYKSQKVSESDYGNMVITFVKFELVEGGNVLLGFDGKTVYSKIVQ